MSDLSVLILTFNEELHIERCIKSLLAVTDKIFIVDSYSTDNTVEIARALGVKVLQNEWTNYAQQYQWGLDNTPFDTVWVMRMDSDEYILPQLANEINRTLRTTTNEVSGFFIKRRVNFMGRWIKHGGYYPIWLLRIWRYEKGKIEERWMDEHIKLTDGSTMHLLNDLVDDNKNALTWWTNKHNNYATREAADLLNTIYKFKLYDEVEPKLWGTQEQRKRKLKHIYARMPLFIRPFIYFIWRYFIKLGILDGKQGLIWHFLQGFWYRFLVDAKIYDIYRLAGKDKEQIKKVLKDVYKIDLGE
tara:strand:+ start:157 stop:1062 length:906 start_codon:yes stop_codon:yes gene_type:complete